MIELVSMLEAAIFDLDGVLLDSTGAVFDVRAKLLANHGVNLSDVPDPNNESHKGSSIRGLLAAVNKYSGVYIDESSFADEAMATVQSALQELNVIADPQLILLLNDLRDNGIPCAVNSSGLRQGVNNKLGVIGIEQYFEVITAAEDIDAHKPDPSSYILTMKKLDAKARNCVIFEDTTVGMEADHLAGGKVVQFTGYTKDKETSRYSDLKVDNWGDLSYKKLLALVSA